MSLEFLVAGPDDWAGVQLVQSLVYRSQLPGDPWDAPGDDERRYLVKEGGEPAAAATLYNLPTLVRGKVIPTGGVAGVATRIEKRRTGGAHLLLEGMVKDMAEREVPLSALYPYREHYYRRFGYETCGWRWEIKCPASRLPKWDSTLPVRLVSPDEAHSLLGPCYEAFIRTLSGSSVRTAEGWKDRMGQTPPTIYAVGDPVQGYLWGSFAAFWEEVSLGEFVWTTPESYRSLLAVLAGICSNKTGAKWCEPPLSPLLYTCRDQGIDMQVHRSTMWRVTHVGAAIKALAPTEEFTFHLRDELVVQNNGVWRAQSGGVTLGHNPDFSLDIRAFSQAYMGQPSLEELERIGQVEVHNREGFERACRTFGPQNVVCMEFF